MGNDHDTAAHWVKKNATRLGSVSSMGALSDKKVFFGGRWLAVDIATF